MPKHHLPMVNRRHFLGTALAGSAVLGSTLMGFPAIAESRKQLTIGYIPILDHLALAVSHARDNATFRKLDIKPRLFKSWNSIAGALRAGVIDGAFLLSSYAMDRFNKGLDIRAVLVGHRHGSGITVKSDANIYKSADLVGKRVAIPARISTHTALLDLYLRQEGHSLADVKTLVIAPPHMVRAMQRGSVDAFIVAEPFCAKAEHEKTGRTLVLSKNIMPQHICCTLVMRNEVLKTNPEGMQEWVGSLVRAGQEIDRMKIQGEIGKVATLARQYMPYSEKILHESLANPADRVIFNNLNPRLEDYQRIVEISRQAGILGEVDLNRFIDADYYRRATAQS